MSYRYFSNGADTLSVKESYSFLGAIFGSFMLAAHKDWIGLFKWLCVKLIVATILCAVGYQIGANNAGASEEEWKLIESQLNGLDAIVHTETIKNLVRLKVLPVKA